MDRVISIIKLPDERYGVQNERNVGDLTIDDVNQMGHALFIWFDLRLRMLEGEPTPAENIDLDEEILEAQADLQTALGFFRLGSIEERGNSEAIEDRLNKSLARLHRLLERLGRSMYQPATHADLDDPWVCEKCGQQLRSEADLCNSGIHVGPGDGEEAQGEAVRLSESKFDQVTRP
jgi:hypothetical protein